MRRPRRRFALRLALAMGRPDVDAMLAELSESQFREWQGFYLLEPWGQAEADRRSALLCAVTCGSASLAPFRYHPPVAADPVRPQTPEEMKAALRQET